MVPAKSKTTRWQLPSTHCDQALKQCNKSALDLTEEKSF